MTPDHDLAARALVACIGAGMDHLTRYEDMPCERCLNRAAGTASSAGGPATAGGEAIGAAGSSVPALADDGITDAEPACPAALNSSPPRVSDTRGGGTGHRYGPQGA